MKMSATKVSQAGRSLVSVRTLAKEDLAIVAAIHLAAFPDSALGSLGAEAVRRYYEWQLIGPHDIAAFSAECDGELAGFCFGGVFRGAMSGFLSRNRAYLAWRVVTHPWLIFSPLFRDRLTTGLRVLRKFAKPAKPKSVTAPVSKTAPVETPRREIFGILALAVNPKFQGKGIGRRLMDASEAIARERGFPQIHLSVNTDNNQAIFFYEGLNWQKVLKEGIWQGEMTKQLKPE